MLVRRGEGLAIPKPASLLTTRSWLIRLLGSPRLRLVSRAIPRVVPCRLNPELCLMATTKSPFGQYFTPASIVEFMLDLVRQGPEARVLEPSAGKGAFLEALLARGHS